ncbi:MAG: 4-hydroxy-tetrahydrodipicolinate reductase [Oscillospiraceae bacterium]|nr:4-hydroxy-tetrahydrodipicolinate reductase [Oscillospiraceae bacterium]
MKIKILLNGCNGRMGRMFTRVAANYGDMEVVAGMDIAELKPGDMAVPPAYPVFLTSGGGSGGGADGDADGGDASPGAALEKIKDIAIDAIVDFSHPSALSFVLELAKARSIPAVLATTGYTDAQMTQITDASAKIPVFQTPNMSIGINLMAELIKTAATALADGFDIELVEAHHNQKIDAPSGTALMLANVMNEALSGDREYVYDRHDIRAKRGKKEIGIHAIRGGTIVGEHSVIFAGNDEVIEVKHTATSREVFAEGAVRAVRFITEAGRKPGRYNMRDVIMQ